MEVLLESQYSLKQIAEKIGVSIPTLQKHYREVIAAFGLRPGPKTFEPTEQQRSRVMTLAGLGLAHAHIAVAIGLSKASLQTHFEDQLGRGRAEANRRVAANLFRAATSPIDFEKHGHRGDLLGQDQDGLDGA